MADDWDRVTIPAGSPLMDALERFRVDEPGYVYVDCPGPDDPSMAACPDCDENGVRGDHLAQYVDCTVDPPCTGAHAVHVGWCEQKGCERVVAHATAIVCDYHYETFRSGYDV